MVDNNNNGQFIVEEHPSRGHQATQERTIYTRRTERRYTSSPLNTDSK